MLKGNLACPHTKPEQLDDNLMAIMNRIQIRTGKEYIVTSGVRCPICNKADGGKPASAHLPDKNGISHALDIKTESGNDRYILVSALLNEGIVRIGIGRTFIHCDNNKDNPQMVIWDYY